MEQKSGQETVYQAICALERAIATANDNSNEIGEIDNWIQVVARN